MDGSTYSEFKQSFQKDYCPTIQPLTYGETVRIEGSRDFAVGIP